MMRDYIPLGAVPLGEEFEQLAVDSYDARMARRQALAYMAQLQRMFGPPPFGSYFRVKSRRDDGNIEVIISYGNAYGEAYARRVETDLPTYWDSEARRELGLVTV